eukprot:2019196-Amphidinium_carterae.1
MSTNALLTKYCLELRQVGEIADCHCDCQASVHGAQYARFRGFSQEEPQAARSNMHLELRRYRQADVVRQQQQLGELQRQLEKASKDAVEEHRATLSDRYRTEFVTELRS